MVRNDSKIVFLDRDGVINENREDYVKSWEEFKFIPGAGEAIKLLNINGYKVIVVTNQSAIGRGLLSIENLDKIHQNMLRELKKIGARIDAIYVCPHRPEERCSCRKPKTGLIEKAIKDFNINLDDAWLIGDSKADMELASNVGCKKILVLTGLGRKTLVEDDVTTEYVAQSLLDAVKWLINTQMKSAQEREERS